MPPLCDFEQWIDTEMCEDNKRMIAQWKKWDEDARQRRKEEREKDERRQERLLRERAHEAEEKAKREVERKRKRERAKRAKEAGPVAATKGKWPRCTQ